MVEPNSYCKVSGMTMRCISQLNSENIRLPTVIEIGCADGQGTMRFAGFCKKVYCIDPMVSERPDIDSRQKSDLPADGAKLADFERRNRDFPVQLIRGCSLWPETIKELEDFLWEEKVDILVVDGCHHPFEAVWEDFVTYEKYVKKGGFVIFDDIYEDCIFEAYKKAQLDYGMIEFDRWGIREPHILQDTGALRK